MGPWYVIYSLTILNSMILAPKSRWKRRSEQLEVGLALRRVWQTGAEDEAPNWEPPDPNNVGIQGSSSSAARQFPPRAVGRRVLSQT